MVIVTSALAFPFEERNEKYREMTEYLSSEEGYWINHDIWLKQDGAFEKAGILNPLDKTAKQCRQLIADFSGLPSIQLKTEAKYFTLYVLKEKNVTLTSFNHGYSAAVAHLCDGIPEGVNSFSDLTEDWIEAGDLPDDLSDLRKKVYKSLKIRIREFMINFYDDRPETERDVWHALKIPGTRLSAASMRNNPRINFSDVPEFYRPMVKTYIKRQIYKRSWSYCTEMLIFIRYFFRSFYNHGYQDGFLANLSRKDIEEYLGWVAADYAKVTASTRSRAVSIIFTFLDYIQMSNYPGSPEKRINTLIFPEDIPRRERPADTMEKIKFIPKPVRYQLDEAACRIQPPRLFPMYVLLRETGWRGTDILDLRYDNCLDYIWSDRDQAYIPYLCGEITKVGIPKLKVPIHDDVKDMVVDLINDARAKSTDENNPNRFLFNTYEGRYMGLPYSKDAFRKAMKSLIKREDIRDADGSLYKFKTHSLRHTRACEYAEQGMPITIIQQMLGHCSIQMTLYYVKVSENTLYEKWRETEPLDLFRLEARKSWESHDDASSQSRPDYSKVSCNLDAVKVPFGTCFKPSKLGCKHQINLCLECGSFCTCEDDLPEYEAEIRRVKEKIRLGKQIGRDDWVAKNQEYLEVLEKMVQRIKTERIVHKNGGTREDSGV